ncbi:MAG: hypothetical protein U0W40_13800 [Acidimicrobiia bacterium]
MTRGRLGVGVLVFALALGALGGTLGVVLPDPDVAGAFGTINGLGQRGEHERITRVLACTADDPVRHCMEPLTIAVLAGKAGTFGGVGAPDIPPYLVGHPENHCDDADHDIVGGAGGGGDAYPQSAAQATAQLQACVDQYHQRIDAAVDAADGLVADGRVNAEQTDVANCRLPNGAADADITAKCSVLNQLGRALHTAEDFYSHSNWVDQADPSRPTGLDNPPGLGRDDLAPWFDVGRRGAVDAPANLVTGCDDSVPVFNPCKGRITHSTLNKDKAAIDADSGRTSDPTTPRGQIGDNAQAAVTAARRQARHVWNQFDDALAAEYGTDRARLMASAGQGHPVDHVRPRRAGAALGAPTGPAGTGNVTVEPTIVNQSGERLGCVHANIDDGEWGIMAPDEVGAGQQVAFRELSNGGGATGTVVYAIGDTGTKVQWTWRNPLVGFNDYTCEVLGDRAAYECSVGGTKRVYHATPTFVISRR